MARTLQVSYISLNSPNKEIWTDYTDINTLYPEISLLEVPYTAGGRVKIIGENLPGIHGIYPVKGMVAEQSLVCRFLIRHRNSSQDAQAVARKFVTWLYNVGEIRVSFDNEQLYRRMKYTDAEQYKVFDGIHGYDIELVVTFTALDSLVYLWDQIQYNTVFDGWPGTKELQRDGFSVYLTGTEIINDGVETPLLATLYTLSSYTPMTSTSNGYWNFIEVSQDMIHYDRFSFSFGDSPTTYTAGRYFQTDNDAYTFVSRNGNDSTAIQDTTIIESCLRYVEPLGKPTWETEKFPDKIINETVMPTLKPGINYINACMCTTQGTLSVQLDLKYRERYM